MSTRKQKSGGQAIVMVSLALFSMAGMMGLAVDLGWSYFIQKEAQASADGAALAAVHEAWARLGGSVGSVSCGNSKATDLWCSSTAPGVACGTGNASGASNLYAGCLYAINNGFNYVSNNKMTVWMQADVGGNSQPVTPTGASLNIDPNNIKYWATVRAVTTVPQLFSSLLGNTQGTIAALATAAVAAETTPGSFIGLNREGDCLTQPNGTKYNCGVDIDLTSSGQTDCYNNDGTKANVKAKVCGPAGVYLASQCNGRTITGCGTVNSTTGYAGETTNNPTVWAGQTGTHIRLAGAVDTPANWTPNPPGAVNGSDSNMFLDPTRSKPQPGLATPANSIPLCPVLDTSGKGGEINGNVGPYQYYSYLDNSGNKVPTGRPIQILNGDTVHFDSGYGCPSIPNSSSSSASPTYVFYGGLYMNGNAGTSTNFGAGQYVMAGTNAPVADGRGAGSVFFGDGGTITGDTVKGTMFLFTDGTYAGALTPPTGMPTLSQGNVDIKNVNITLSGITSSSPIDQTFKDILFWQDRRNSTDTLNLADFGPGGNGSITTQGTPCSGCGVTSTSPAIILEDGNGTLNLTGVSYQPRGAWIDLQAGVAGVAVSHLQIVTGALTAQNGSGSSAITLLGPSAPVIIYVTSLIQ